MVNGKLYPLFVDANTEMLTEQWLLAKVGHLTDETHVKSRLGPLALRPGFHSCKVPFVDWIGKKGDDGKLYQRLETVWCECMVEENQLQINNKRGLTTIPNGWYYYRKVCRQKKVRPLLDEYFRLIHTLDTDNPEYSDKMKKGIRYAQNHEAELRRFLDDGNIPCDNGACERHIRPFSVARKAWLFCNTMSGAKAAAILYTLVETAKANNADPYYYLKYLLDSMPAHMEDHDRSFLTDMMPWPDAFKTYAVKEKAELIQKYSLNPSDVPPFQVQRGFGTGNSDSV